MTADQQRKADEQVAAALAEGTVLTESMARLICGWTDKIPAACRPDADDILITAAKAGMRREDLAGLAAEIYARSLTDPATTIRAWRSKTGRSGWRPRSPGPE